MLGTQLWLGQTLSRPELYLREEGRHWTASPDLVHPTWPGPRSQRKLSCTGASWDEQELEVDVGAGSRAFQTREAACPRAQSLALQGLNNDNAFTPNATGSHRVLLLLCEKTLCCCLFFLEQLYLNRKFEQKAQSPYILLPPKTHAPRLPHHPYLPPEWNVCCNWWTCVDTSLSPGVQGLH